MILTKSLLYLAIGYGVMLYTCPDHSIVWAFFLHYRLCPKLQCPPFVGWGKPQLLNWKRGPDQGEAPEGGRMPLQPLLIVLNHRGKKSTSQRTILNLTTRWHFPPPYWEECAKPRQKNIFQIYHFITLQKQKIQFLLWQRTFTIIFKMFSKYNISSALNICGSMDILYQYTLHMQSQRIPKVLWVI